MPIRKSNEFTYLFRSVPNLTIPFEQSSCKNLYIIDQLFKKFVPLARKRMRKKRFDWDLSRGCSTQQHRYNTRHSSLEEKGRASMHCYGERIVTPMFPPCSSVYIYIFGKHRDSPISLDLSKRASSFFSFFFFRTYLLSPLQNRPCAFSRPLLIIRNFFSKNLKISSSAVFDTIVRKMSHIPVGEKLVEKL